MKKVLRHLSEFRPTPEGERPIPGDTIETSTNKLVVLEKPKGIPLFCIGEEGQNILAITVPERVLVPTWTLEETGPPSQVHRRLTLALLVRLGALINVAQETGNEYHLVYVVDDGPKVASCARVGLEDTVTATLTAGMAAVPGPAKGDILDVLPFEWSAEDQAAYLEQAR